MDHVTKMQARIEDFACEKIFLYRYADEDGTKAFINFIKDMLIPHPSYFTSTSIDGVKEKLKMQKMFISEIEKTLEVSKKGEKDLENTIKKIKKMSSDSKDEEEDSDE